MPTTPTRRLERILLTTWTGALALLVASSIRATHPALAWALLLYLALVARHLLDPPGRGPADPRPGPPAPAEAPDPQGVAGPPGPDPEPVAPGRPIEADPVPAPGRDSPARSRRRARPRAVAEPIPAAWVQVGPGRFVREEQPGAAPSPDEPGACPPEPPVDRPRPDE